MPMAYQSKMEKGDTSFAMNALEIWLHLLDIDPPFRGFLKFHNTYLPVKNTFTFYEIGHEKNLVRSYTIQK